MWTLRQERTSRYSSLQLQLVTKDLVRFYFRRQTTIFINKICQIMSDVDNFSDVNNLDVVDNTGRGNDR
jgi:hypothetical protein